jgi:transketolase
VRKEFAASIENIAKKDERIIFITGDLGFMALENVRDSLGSRFINAGVAEQNMIGMAAGLAKQGFIPIVYSIAPFVVYRCFEQIRNDICFQNLPVILVGNGGGYGYGIMGKTHHAIEDYGVLGTLNIKSYVPVFNNDVENVLNKIIISGDPAYLRLGYGERPENFNFSEFDEWRKITEGESLTIVSIGPVGINGFYAAQKIPDKIEYWMAGCYPVTNIPKELIHSINKTHNLLCIEEHVETGGFGMNLAGKLLEAGCSNFKCKFLSAKGYISDTYGSQKFHQAESGLDETSILSIMKEMIK